MTAARAEEILTLDVEDLDPEFWRARVKSKGGAVEYVHWATGTARILPRLLRGRTTGPVFLAGLRAPASGRRAPAGEDTCPETGMGRLSYSRAEYLFKQASKAVDPHKKGWTLHQLRHSAFQHLAADGCTAPSSRPSPATSTWPASAATSASASRPPPASPPKPTRPPAVAPANQAAVADRTAIRQAHQIGPQI